MEDNSEACIKNTALNVVGWNKEIMKKTSEYLIPSKWEGHNSFLYTLLCSEV